jgi:hypothetical protein
MPKFPLPVTLIKHRGFFSYSDLLQAIIGWYAHDNYEVDMPMYKQKFPQVTGTEHEFKIHAEKKVTEYVKFHIDLFIRVYNMRDIEIIQEGKKMKLQDGQVQIEVIPFLELDWQKRFSGPPPWQNFLKALDDFYRSYIIKYKIVDYWEDMILLKSSQLGRVMKEALGQEVM